MALCITRLVYSFMGSIGIVSSPRVALLYIPYLSPQVFTFFFLSSSLSHCGRGEGVSDAGWA